MQYIFLIYGSESQMPEPPKDKAAFAEWMRPWAEYSESLKNAGVLVGGDALESTATATTISRVGSAEPVFSDGPFAETKEQLGGYYLVNCKNLDEALGWASKCPGVAYGKVEVRPVADFG